MSKKKKKEKDKKKHSDVPAADLESEVQRLRDENEMLRARLEKISELSSELPGGEHDDQEQEHEVTDDARAEPVGVGLS